MKVHNPKLLLLLMLMIFAEIISAQQISRVEADFTAGPAFINFTDNAMVPPKRRNKLGIGDETMVNSYISFSIKKQSLLKLGLGYTERKFSLNKYSLGDIFLAIIVWGADPDTFRVNQTKLRSGYLNIPVAYSYDLRKDPDKKVHVLASLQLNASFLVNRNVSLTFDPNYSNPSPTEQQQIQQSYENTMRGFVLSVQPRMDVNFELWKGGGLQLGVMPFIFYLNSWNKSLATNYVAFTSTLGIHYNF